MHKGTFAKLTDYRWYKYYDFNNRSPSEKKFNNYKYLTLKVAGFTTVKYAKV